MIETIMAWVTTWIFPLVVLSIWSQSDVKLGKIQNISLVIPLFFSYFWNGYKFGQVFVPAFAFMLLLFLSMRVLDSRLPVGKMIGFADVIALPFAVMWLPIRNPAAMSVFAVVFAVLLVHHGKKQWDSKLKTDIRSRVKLMPVLLLAYCAALLTLLLTSSFF